MRALSMGGSLKARAGFVNLARSARTRPGPAHFPMVARGGVIISTFIEIYDEESTNSKEWRFGPRPRLERLEPGFQARPGEPNS